MRGCSARRLSVGDLEPICGRAGRGDADTACATPESAAESLPRTRQTRTGSATFCRVFALIIKAGANPSLHDAMNRLGHGNAAGFGQPFEPRSDVHAVAIDRAKGTQVRNKSLDIAATLPAWATPRYEGIVKTLR